MDNTVVQFLDELSMLTADDLRRIAESLDSEACAFVFSLAHRYNAPELKTAVPVSAQRLQDLWVRFAR